MGLDNPIHIAFLLVILLLVFGAKRLPEMGHSLGSGLRGFKDSLSGDGRFAPRRRASGSTPIRPDADDGRPRSRSAASTTSPARLRHRAIAGWPAPMRSLRHPGRSPTTTA